MSADRSTLNLKRSVDFRQSEELNLVVHIDFRLRRWRLVFVSMWHLEIDTLRKSAKFYLE